MKSTEVKEKFFAIGIEAVGSTGDELAGYIRADTAKTGKLIRQACIRAD